MATKTKKAQKPTKSELVTAAKKSRAVISEWVKTSRIKADMSQDALASFAGVDRKTVNRIENGHFSPNLDTMTRLSLVLGKKIPQL
jgi:DNA-binding XRE family transcriptional regulator